MILRALTVQWLLSGCISIVTVNWLYMYICTNNILQLTLAVKSHNSILHWIMIRYLLYPCLQSSLFIGKQNFQKFKNIITIWLWSDVIKYLNFKFSNKAFILLWSFLFTYKKWQQMIKSKNQISSNSIQWTFHFISSIIFNLVLYYVYQQRVSV